MPRPEGYAIIVDPDRQTMEFDSIQCAHCQRICLMRGRQDTSDLGGFCMTCSHHICGPCADKGTCTPFEKKLEQAEARDRFRRQLGV